MVKKDVLLRRANIKKDSLNAPEQLEPDPGHCWF